MRVTLVHDERTWRTYCEPLAVVEAWTAAEVPAALAAIDAALDAGRSVAGYVAYELGDALRAPDAAETGGSLAAATDVSGAAAAVDRDAPHAMPLVAVGVFAAATFHARDAAPAAVELAPMAAGVSRDAYARALGAIARGLHAGDVYQVNVVVPFEAPFGAEPWPAFEALAARASAPHAAYVEHGARAYLSLSPELFLGFDGRDVRTRPMKGTVPPGGEAALGGAKNRAEHVMIVDLLRNDLHRVCGCVDVERLFAIERYPTFATMTSTIRGTLRDGATLRDVLAATFPCGSITGAPKRSAMRAIARLEGEPRGIAMGAIGWLEPAPGAGAGARRGWWNVAIRTLAVDLARATATLRVGGGIVADSTASDEWAEILVKRRLFASLESPAGLFETLRADAPPATVAAHLARMAASAERFGIAFEPAAAAALLAREAPAGEVVRLLRLTLRADGSLACDARELEPSPAVATLAIAPVPLRASDPLLRHKTSRRAPYDAALAHARGRGCFEGLLRNDRGELADGARTTLFARIGGMLRTPALDCGALAGVLRAALLASGEAVEAVLRARDLERAEALYVGSSARGLVPARLER